MARPELASSGAAGEEREDQQGSWSAIRGEQERRGIFCDELEEGEEVEKRPQRRATDSRRCGRLKTERPVAARATRRTRARERSSRRNRQGQFRRDRAGG